MTEKIHGSDAAGAIPPDDLARTLSVVDDEHPAGGWVSLVGDTYSMLLTGEQTNGAYCLIDMRVPPGGGPPPHRHDFEELFIIVSGQVEFTFRGDVTVVGAGSSVNIPANAPHRFRNAGDSPARMLCMCSPAGQEEYFTRVGDAVDGPTAPPPDLSPADQAVRQQRALDLAAQYRTEMLS
ncbi:hypothetical protein GCM10027169_19980 [Gordonia jinhuaensis]|nr:cupin domain-containing protein [Gordonia jinhuaensis]